jgi:hypothetical protein
MKKNGVSLMAFLSFLTVITFCDHSYFGTLLTRNSSNDPTNVDQRSIPVPDNGNSDKNYFAVTSIFAVPDISTIARPEILFLVDSSASMADEKNALISAMAGWLANLQNQGVENFCVDVMESNYTSSTAGLLRAKAGNPKCLCTDTLSVSQIVTKFGENINTIVFTGGDGEAGLYSLNKALTDSSTLAANQTAGCFKADHNLAPILITDEQDMGATADTLSCSSNATGKTSSGSTVNMNTVVFDNTAFPVLNAGYVTSPTTATNYANFTCNEAQVRLQYYSEATPQSDGKYHLIISPQSVADAAIAYNDSLATFSTGIVYNTTTFPTATGPESKGWGILEYAAVFGQTTANLASASNQTSFNAQMANIADALVNVVGYIYKYDLKDQNGTVIPVCPGQEDSLVVKVNGITISTSKYYLNHQGTWFRFYPDFNWSQYGSSPAVTAKYTRCE